MSAQTLECFRYRLAGMIMSYARSNAGLPFEVVGKSIIAATVVSLGLFAYSALFAGTDKQSLQAEVVHLRQQIEAITGERDQLARERDQAIQTGQDLRGVQNQVAAAMQELRELDSLRASVSQAIEQARIQLTGPSDLPIAPADMSTTGATSAVPLSKEQIRAAQEALIDSGYGNLDADGVYGAGTRKAVEAFERAKGLPVTGQLGAATLAALRSHIASVAQ